MGRSSKYCSDPARMKKEDEDFMPLASGRKHKTNTV